MAQAAEYPNRPLDEGQLTRALAQEASKIPGIPQGYSVKAPEYSSGGSFDAVFQDLYGDI